MKFTQDFEKDLDVLLQAFLAKERFCLLRFGDGESAILRNRPRSFSVARDGERWSSANIPVENVQALEAALREDAEGLYIATVCPACSGQSSAPLRTLVTCPVERQTYAEIFGNVNWSKLKNHVGLLRTNVCLVSSHPSADIRIPSNLIERPLEEHWKVVKEMRRVRRPLALAAGPSACILGHMYWLAPLPEERQPCVDVGALFDLHLWGKRTRHYMPEGAARGRRVCTWDGTGVGLDTD